MKGPRLAVASLALLAVTAIAASGCGPAKDSSAGGTTSASPSRTANPKDTLVKAATALTLTSEKISMSIGGKQVAAGAVDLPDKALDLTFSIKESGASLTFETLYVDAGIFMTLDFGPTLNRQYKIDPKKWMKIDKTKLTNASSLTSHDPNNSDPMGLARLDTALADVRTTDGTTYTGTVDLKALGDSVLVANEEVNKYGDKVKAVPFTATVTADGHLASFKTDGTGIGDDVTEDIEFSDFGQATISKPTSYVNASAAVYQLLNIKG